MALIACSNGSAHPATMANRDAGSVTCQAGALVLSGPNVETPHGSYLLSNVVSSSASFSATLPGGGSVEFDWTGDATAGDVAITGQLTIPSDGEAGPTIWCVDTPSTLHVTGSHAALVLIVGPQDNGFCSATGDGGSDVETVVGCVDLTT